MLKTAVEQELADYINERIEIVDEDGRRLVVRNGLLPEREIVTGVGPVAVRQPRVRDKRPPRDRECLRRECFRSTCERQNPSKT